MIIKVVGRTISLTHLTKKEINKDQRMNHRKEFILNHVTIAYMDATLLRPLNRDSVSYVLQRLPVNLLGMKNCSYLHT